MYVEEKALGEVKEKSFSQVMEEAANLLEKRGRMLGNFYSVGRAQLCTYAAIYEAAEGTPVDVGGLSYLEHHGRFERYLQKTGHVSDSGAGSICSFNNASSDETVLHALRDAAKVG